ncbi:CPBP family intramembrane glutamic endopeptidase [Mangrovimonas sp. TPBH4]|uniref:CPBP family intramembrane glutamic endopeptidase n=1 Tax=Mangrovimonas sp. TPBH4 TaxID=1645914 RepID=UPI0006B59A79|nr:CPBP family intramembrane glutamic endopeptidase [Mangrovimonas sp. TPBH4]
MRTKEFIINIIAICAIVILPHTGLIPLFGYSIPILLFVWIVLKYSNETFSDIGFSFKRFKTNSILIGSLVAVVSLSFMQLVFFPILEYFVTFEEPDIGLYDFIRDNKWQYFFTLIMGWLIGGFYEEIVFHGFIYTRLEKMIQGRYSTYISFVLTACIFGAYHFQLGILGLINALIIGTVYLLLFLFLKRNLWYSIICHGVYNSIVMTMIYHEYL